MEVNESSFEVNATLIEDIPFSHTRHITLRNSGRIGLPWMVDEDTEGGSEDSKSFFVITPKKGYIRSGSSQELTVKFDVQVDDHGHFLGHARIRGNPDWRWGTCFRSERLRFEI